MSESNHNQSFDEDNNGSPATSRASSPAPPSSPPSSLTHPHQAASSPPFLPYSPIFGANNNFPQQLGHNNHQHIIKEEPVDPTASNTTTTPDFRFSQNLFSHLFGDKKLFYNQDENARRSHNGQEGHNGIDNNSVNDYNKHLSAFSSNYLPAIIRERLEAAALASSNSESLTQSNALFRSNFDIPPLQQPEKQSNSESGDGVEVGEESDGNESSSGGEEKAEGQQQQIIKEVSK